MLTLFKIKILKWRVKLLITRYHRTKNPIGSGRRKKVEMVDMEEVKQIVEEMGKEEGGSG